MAEKFVPSDANAITRQYLDSILIEQRLVGADVPQIGMELFGRQFATPIMMPAFSHLHVFTPEREDGMCEYARAAKALGAVNFVGMGPDEEFSRIAAVGAPTVRIVKPYLDRDKVRAQLAHAVSCGALAVGMDIDHSFSSSGGHDSVFGEEMAPVSKAELAELVSSVSVPFVVKGVLSVRDALACAEAGAQAILVSHHHGRMPFAVPPAMVLPEIRRAVGGKMKIFADCGVASGADAYKLLALGADAVAVGRAIMAPLAAEGAKGVEAYVGKINDELKMLMAFTGCRSLSMLDPSALWIGGKKAE
ncbi:MAG: alpha-hydroxy-acid oxidizing protein [Oscillospiraceae bacterium]|nr:alpha-hydroxy-acid oxidizing protein [Oscillospiraceae bacterium]